MNLGAAFVESDRYDVIGKTDLSPADVAIAYLIGVVAIAPVLGLGYYFETFVKPTFKPPMEVWLLCLFVISAVWPIVILYLANLRTDTAFKGSPETKIPR